jgi:2-polyprenyl-3-methyl-5-hydroxy-6-metoxy-1,4-benzoquinol methylase
LYLNLPPRRRDPDPSGPVLVSFGGEDPAGITLPVLELVLGAGMKAARIHLTLPAGLRGKTLPGKAGELKILEAPENLREHLGNYGLVFCSYGLTLWEAAAAGCAVITVDPSSYHARLSAEAGFPGLGYMNAASSGSIRKTGRKLRNLLNSPEELRESAGRISARLEGHSEITLAGLLESLDSPEPRCTACGRILPRVIARFPRRSYYRCSDCGIIGLYRFTPPPENEYGSSYFQQEYEKQYGKSYLDDFQSIRTMGFSRLRLISRRGKKGGNLLDIGCAFGPFLHAAREAGYRCRGIDISEEAVAYVRDKLGIPAISGAFPGEDPSGRLKEAFGTGEFDIITLWYVIEHFQDLKRVLEALNSLLPVKGVLAMSTPNAAGISGRRSLRTFLEKSPEDHYSIWSPRTARVLLSRYGFRVYRIRVTGHHPERFSALHRSTGEDPGRDGDVSRRGAAALGSVRRKFLGLVSRIFSLGDTFEIYAVKERSLV